MEKKKNFDVSLIRLSFHIYHRVHLIHVYTCKCFFDPNITFQLNQLQIVLRTCISVLLITHNYNNHNNYIVDKNVLIIE